MRSTTPSRSITTSSDALLEKQGLHLLLLAGPMPIRIAIAGLLLLNVPLLSTQQTAQAQAASAQVNGVSLPYEIEGSGKPLVLVHGWAVHRAFWDDDVARLADRYMVIRYDRRGFGDATGKPDPTADPADLKALLDELGLTRVHIMGHSQGSGVALTFALRFPEMVDGLILFGPGRLPGLNLPSGENDPPVAEWVAAARAYGIDSLHAAIGAWAAEWFGDLSPDMGQRARELLASYSGLDLIDPDPPSNLVQPARVDELSAVRAPTMIIHGEQDMPSIRITAQVLSYGIPGARTVVIPGGGHTVNWNEPERFAAEVLRFLREVEEGSGTSLR